ncbi:CHRD domain-containing protein [Sphaerisporangium sp. NPDC004334]
MGEQIGNRHISWRRLMVGVTAGTVAATAAGAVIAAPAGAAPQSAAHTLAATAQTAHTATTATSASSRKYYFEAGLLGRNEVPEPGKKVNDRDGRAVARFRISGKRIYYIVQWSRTGRPTAFHIHRGKAGVNGPVVINLLSSGDIRGNIARGSAVASSSLLRDIKNHPTKWYANLHTAQFPDGAVRGQLHTGRRW